MRAIMARLRGPRATTEPLPENGPNMETAAGGPVPVWAMPKPPRNPPYIAALLEARQMCRNLGLDLSVGSQAEAYEAVGDLVRYVYGEGWLACESRLGCRDMADLIDQAINQPGSITEKWGSESDNGHRVRAVQQIVAYGVKSEPH